MYLGSYDFLIQTKEESPSDGIHIYYKFCHDNWHRLDPGPGRQSRWKNVGEKWNNYHTRVRRNVAYLGSQRVVPHFERSAHKSYRARFQATNLDDKVRKEIGTIAGKILGRSYSGFELHQHSKYSLPIVSSKKMRYSGFNMGGGESSVFEILTAVFESGEGALLVVDEIELGLHEKAQRRLIEELKKLCKKRHCQIICSTHSHVILDTLPPEGRFFIEGTGGGTLIIRGISSELACGKLGGAGSNELDVYVEDDVAEAIFRSILPMAIRERINIHPIGSVEAALRLLSSKYLEIQDDSIIILDETEISEKIMPSQSVA